MLKQQVLLLLSVCLKDPVGEQSSRSRFRAVKFPRIGICKGRVSYSILIWCAAPTNTNPLSDATATRPEQYFSVGSH